MYKGFRVTATQHPLGGHLIVTVSVKRARDRWDDWSLLFPAVRVNGPVLDSAADVGEAILTALTAVIEELNGD